MEERIALDMLTTNSVSLKKQKFATVDGDEYPIGEPWRKAYVNSINGRSEVETEVSEPYKTAILSVWGASPTVDDPSVD